MGVQGKGRPLAQDSARKGASRKGRIKQEGFGRRVSRHAIAEALIADLRRGICAVKRREWWYPCGVLRFPSHSSLPARADGPLRTALRMQVAIFMVICAGKRL